MQKKHKVQVVAQAIACKGIKGLAHSYEMLQMKHFKQISIKTSLFILM